MTTFYDILQDKTTEIKCLDHGFVKLVDCSPRIVPDKQTADYAIVQAARVSYGEGTKSLNEDSGLIRYLMRHRHTTPFEMVEFKFLCKMPIFVARQWIRHRTASVNEYSARYSLVKDEFYLPTDNVRRQSTKNKQGGEELISCGNFVQDLEFIANLAYENYEAYIDSGVARELSRMFLPINYYTEWYWKIDLHNLLHFLALRCDSHAQKEIQVYGNAMLNLIENIVPITIKAWNDYHPMRDALLLTSLEIEAIKNKTSTINSENKREQEEWENKKKKLGITI